MKIHITNLYNQLGTQGIAQQKMAKIAKELGFYEMGLYRIHKYTDLDESDRELGARLDGVISSVQPGDIVFVQSPSWNGLRYDRRVVSKLKVYDVKIVIFIHDVIPLAFNSGEENLRDTIEIYNYADLIVVPSQAMLDLLRKYGLTVPKCMVQEMWDYPVNFELNKPKFEKRIFFTGAPIRFSFVQNWKYSTPMVLYTGVDFAEEGLNMEVRGYQKEAVLLSDLSEGGYGLVWPSDEENEYYQLIQPYKIGSYLAAGIPVILQKGLATEKAIVENGLGFAVESLEEADRLVQSISEEEYNQMVERIAEFNFLVKDGWFAKKMFADAVMMLLNKNQS